jgi:putative glutamine amidotransferase
MARPIIGVCGALEQVRYGVWDVQAALTPRSYIDAITRAGGMAIILPPDPWTAQAPDEALDLVDGLVLAGGTDIDPAAYGAQRHPSVTVTVPERDSFEIALARRALERDLPLLGICRGMQLMNVARGGTLRQHLPEDVGHEDHRRVPGSFDGSDHDVRLAAGSLAARAAGEQRHGTLSHHHQGVDAVGEGLVVTGWSVMDDLPEAIEDPARGFALGVQWHPEADERSRLIATLVDEARERRAGLPAV